MPENSCYTYFRITGDFDPDIISARLGLQPEKFWRIGDKRHNGTEYDFASWEIGRCEQYDVQTENQMIQPSLLSWIKFILLMKSKTNSMLTIH